MVLSDEDIEALKVLANGYDVDDALWPGIVERLPAHLDYIAEKVFPPVPPLPPRPILVSEEEPQTNGGPSPSYSDSFTEKTAANTPPPSSRRPSSPPPPKPTHQPNITPGAIPNDMLELMATIVDTLQMNFPTHPPHTIQRLAELVIEPKRHYRFLPAYLHALDRVVHVTSSANTYPLPALVPDAAGKRILTNGAVDPESVSWGSSTTAPQGYGGDEALGGALLTPIPWLKGAALKSPQDGSTTDASGPVVRKESTKLVDGPNGLGGVETVSVSLNGVSSATVESTEAQLRAEGGVTQGELLRQEQQAGVVPRSQVERSTHPLGDGEAGESPHARGPSEIGDEDIGPQREDGVVKEVVVGIDVAAAVGRPLGEDEIMTPVVREEDEEGEEEVVPQKRKAEEVSEGRKRSKSASPVPEEGKTEEEKVAKETDDQLKSEMESAMDTTA